MGIQIKHILTAATIFATLGFLYIITLAPIDITRSPRAAALNQTPTARILITNIRTQLATQQHRAATATADQLTTLFPTNPNAHLNAAYAYRIAGNYEKESQSWQTLLNWANKQNTPSQSTQSQAQQANTLYAHAWALKGLNQPEQSQPLFKQLALLVEPATDPTSPILAYNLACYWSLANNQDRALHYWKLTQTLGYNPSTPPWWKVDPDLEDLHPNETFWQIGNQTP